MEENTQVPYSNISYNQSDTNFDELFKNRPLKFIGVSFACVSMPIVLCLLYGIIWFERFGSGKILFATSHCAQHLKVGF
jgi:hypothetical protein